MTVRWPCRGAGWGCNEGGTRTCGISTRAQHGWLWGPPCPPRPHPATHATRCTRLQELSLLCSPQPGGASRGLLAHFLPSVSNSSWRPLLPAFFQLKKNKIPGILSVCSSWRFSAAVPHTGGLGLCREGAVGALNVPLCVCPQSVVVVVSPEECCCGAQLALLGQWGERGPWCGVGCGDAVMVPQVCHPGSVSKAATKCECSGRRRDTWEPAARGHHRTGQGDHSAVLISIRDFPAASPCPTLCLLCGWGLAPLF